MGFRDSRNVPTIDDVVVDEMIRYIEDQADRKRGLRADYADSVGDNKYRNKTFDSLVTTFLDDWDRVERVYGKGGRLRDEEIIEKAVPIFIDGHFAVSIAADRRTLESLDDDMYNDVIAEAEAWEETWLGKSRRSSRRDDRDDRRGRDDRDRDRGSRSSRGERIELRSSRRSYRDERGRSDTSRDSARSMNISSHDALLNVQAELEDEPEVQVVQRDRSRRNEPEPTRSESYPKVYDERPRRVQGPDWTAKCPHAHFYQDDELWSFSQFVENPILPGKVGESSVGIPTLINIHEQLKFFVTDIDSGETREENIEVSEDTRYLQQEYLVDQQPASFNTPYVDIEGRGAATSEGDDKPTQEKVNTLLSTAMSELPISKVTEVFQGKFQILASMKEISHSVLIRMSNEPTPVVLPMAFLIRDVVPLFKYSPVVEEQLDALFKARNLTHVQELLNGFKDVMEPALFKAVNRRFSNAIRESSCYQWQFHFKTFDFAAHWTQLLEVVKEKESETFFTAYVQRMNSLVATVLARVAPDKVASHLPDLVNDGQQPNAVVFVDYEYVIAMPYTIDELGIGRQLENRVMGVEVGEIPHEKKSLTTVVRNMYAASGLNEAERTVTPLRVMTKDGRLLSIWPHMCRAQKYILCERPVE